MIEDKALLAEYLSESEELLDSLSLDLDTLCRVLSAPGKNKGAPDSALVNRLFRAAHSLKGLLGMMELSDLQSITHEFEDILDDIRLGNVGLSYKRAQMLQEAAGSFAGMLDAAVRGDLSDDALDRLRALFVEFGGGSPVEASDDRRNASQLNFSNKEIELLTVYELRRISENLKAGRHFYAISVQFAVDDLDRLYEAIVSRLNRTGEHITTLPTNTRHGSSVALKLVFATRLKESEILAELKVFGGKIERLMDSKWRRASEALISVGRGKKKDAQEASKPASSQPGSRTMVQIRKGEPSAGASQESLRPLSKSIRVEFAQIDSLSSLAHELALETQKLSSLASEVAEIGGAGVKKQFDLKQQVRRIERQFLALEESLVELRTVYLSQLFTRASRLASKLARDLGKSIQVEVSGRDTHLDKTIVDRVADPLYHILRNAVDHGIESRDQRKRAGKRTIGRIAIESRLEGTRVVITVGDDGAGIDVSRVRARAIEIGAILRDEELTNEETLRLIFTPGFSTAQEVSAVSGRGMGLDVVEKTIFEMGGEIRVTSEAGSGSRFELIVPTTLVMISALIVKSNEWRYAANVNQVVELIQVEPGSISGSDGRRLVNWRGSEIPLVELSFLLGVGGARPLLAPRAEQDGAGHRSGNGSAPILRIPAIVTRLSDRHMAIAVEEFDGQKDIIVKSLGSLAPRIKGIVGAVDLEEGDVALVLDLAALLLMKSVRV